MTIYMPTFKGQIAGMVLGDTYIGKDGGKNARMRITHSEPQREYILHKKKILEQLTSVHWYELPPRGVKHPNIEMSITTRRHPFYTRVYDLAVREKKKTINKTWLSWLNEEGLAIWYMDDGSLSKKWSYNKGGRYRIENRRVYINSCSYSLAENELLAEILKEKFDLNFMVRKSSEYKGREYFRLQAGAKEANKLFEIISPYVLPCLRYKMNMEYDSDSK